jgi:hypothetical protein
MCPVESRGLIELRYPDGQIVTGDYDEYVNKHLNRGDRFECLDMGWVMYDRVDRLGVTVFLCRPDVADDAAPLTFRT